MRHIMFCPKCHRKIVPPNWLFNANIKTEKGITINCGVPGCKGKVKFKPKNNDNSVQHPEPEATENS